MSLTQAELNEIKERAEKASSGPWQVASTTDGEYILDCDEWVVAATFERKEDAYFVAHAREDIPKLIDYITELEAVFNIIREIASEGYATACTSDEARAYGSIIDILNRKKGDEE